MPYVMQAYRDKLDPFIDQLADAVVAETVEAEDELQYAGLLTYCITRLTLLIIKKIFGTKLRYLNLALVPGIMENVKLDFYERLSRQVEIDRRRRNGDIDVIEDFQDELEALI